MNEPFCIFPIISTENELPLFVRGIGKNACERHIERPKGHSCHQLLFATRGEGKLITKGKTYNLKGGMAFFLQKNTQHEYFPVGSDWDTHWLVIDGTAVDDLVKSLGLDEDVAVEISNMNELIAKFNKIRAVLENDRYYGSYRASAYAYEYIIEIFRLARRNEHSAGTSNSSVDAAIVYIEQNYQQNIRLEDLCEAAGVSKQHLCRLFKSTLQMRPMEYVTKVRIQHAKSLLITTNYSIKEIAEMVGFSDNSYFAMLFSRHEFMSPVEYRRHEGG